MISRRRFLGLVAALPLGVKMVSRNRDRHRQKPTKYFPPGIYLHAGFSDSPDLTAVPFGATFGADNPNIEGIVYQIFWATLHPTKGPGLVVSGIQSALAYCRAQGLKLILQIKTGGGASSAIPKWIGGVSVTSSSVANPTVITATAHGYADGDSVIITGHSGSTPDINNTRYTITYINANSFSVPVNVTVGGTGGTVGWRPVLTISTQPNLWPWDKAVRRAWADDLRALGPMFDDDPTLVGIYLSGCQSQYTEMSFQDSTGWATDPDATDADVDAYTVDLLIDNWNKALDGTRQAFPTTPIICLLDQHPNPSGAGTFDTAFYDGSVDVGVLAHICDDPKLQRSVLVGTSNLGDDPAAVRAVENNYGYTLATALPNNDTTVDVVVNEDITEWPNSGTERVFRIDDEEFTYSTRAGSTFSTCVRAANGTSFAAHAVGARLGPAVTEGRYGRMRALPVSIAQPYTTRLGTRRNLTFFEWGNGKRTGNNHDWYNGARFARVNMGAHAVMVAATSWQDTGYAGSPATATQVVNAIYDFWGPRDQFINSMKAICGDIRLLWLPLANEILTSDDESGNGRIFTYNATIAAQISALGRGRQVSFDGIATEADTPDQANLSFVTGAFSIVALVNVTNTAAARAILSKWRADAAVQREWLFWIESNDTLTLDCCDESTDGYIRRQSDAAITMGAWKLFVATYANAAANMDSAVLYQDGLTIASTASVVAAGYVAMEDLATVVSLGKDETTNYLFSGSMAMVALVAKELSAADVLDIKNLCNSHFGLSL